MYRLLRSRSALFLVLLVLFGLLGARGSAESRIVTSGREASGKIAFNRNFGTAPSDVYVMNADGTGLRRLTRSRGEDNYPAWSPDGRRIVFGSERDGNLGLYVMKKDGSRQRRLTRNPRG